MYVGGKMLDSHIPAAAGAIEATGVVESLQPYNLGFHSGFEGSGSGGGGGGSNIQPTAIDSFMEDMRNNYSQLIGRTSVLDLCNQSLLLYGVNNCSSASKGSNVNSTMFDDDISFILPWWRQVLWSILFGGMVIVATGGNLIVVWIVMTTKRMRTVTNYFIVNLSIADAMVSSLNVTFNYIYMLDNDWPFGELYCKISQFVATLSISASVFTLMAIAIDRYVAIIKPLQPRMSKRCNLAIAAFIWAASITLSCPMLLFFTTGEVELKDGIRIVCYTEWPDGPTNHSQQEYVYNIVFMILTYVLPIISMTFTYSRVGFELWGSKAIGEHTPRQVENVKSKRRVVKMMMVVVLIFAVCWLPFHTYFIVTSCYPALTETPFIQEVYLGIYWLAMSNSMYNPIIYCWMNSRFRYGFKLFFRWCPFVHIGAETLNRRDNMTSRYSCSGSPDHNRIKRNGIMRNSTTAYHRDPIRHSAPIGTNNTSAYHQRFSDCSSSHELTTLTSLSGATGMGHYGLVMRRDHMKVPMRNGTRNTEEVAIAPRQMWSATADKADTDPDTPPVLSTVVGVNVDTTNVRAIS